MARKRQITPGPYLLYLELPRDRVTNPDRYPFALPALRRLETLAFHPKVTFLLGENGSGKSTLLEAIAIAWGLNPEGGSLNFNFATRPSHSLLGDSIRLARPPSTPGDSYFLRAESFFNVATEIERLDEGSGAILDAYGGQSLHEQSHGESFFALFRSRFRDNGLYLMDEPEAALSPTRQIAFLALLHDYVKHGCQFVIATHSPIILAYPEATIYQLSDSGISPIDYTETEHYLVTRGFLTNPQRTLSELFREDGDE
jgi:predicted ATPase